MSTVKKEEILRANRYVLRADDDRLLQVRGLDKVDYYARINNISSTGLSFVIHSQVVPDLGDMIGESLELELALPDKGQKIVLSATVVRIAEYEPDVFEMVFSPGEQKSKSIVGVEFAKIPEEHKALVEEALQSKYFEIKNRATTIRVRRLKRFAVMTLLRFVMYFLLIMALTIGGYLVYQKYLKHVL